MNRSVNRMRQAPQRPCARAGASFYQPPVSLTEFNRELQELPLAMAYVPIQSWADVYPPARALSRGTLFPRLDLPFGEVSGT